MNNDEKQIRDLVATWTYATKTGDAETVLNLMTDDVVFLVPGHPPFGKSAFASATQQQSESSTQFEGSSEIQEIQLLGDWAFMRTKLTVKVTQPGSDRAATRSGYTLSILTKKDGKWLLARDANLLVPDADSGNDA